MVPIISKLLVEAGIPDYDCFFVRREGHVGGILPRRLFQKYCDKGTVYDIYFMTATHILLFFTYYTLRQSYFFV